MGALYLGLYGLAAMLKCQKGSLLTFGPNHSRTPPVYNILHARTSMRTLILSLTSPWFLMCVYAMHMFSIVLLFVEQLLVALLFCGQLPVASGSAVLEGSYYQMNNVVFIVSSCCTWVLTLTCQNVLA